MILEFKWPRIMTRSMLRHKVPQYKIMAEKTALQGYLRYRGCNERQIGMTIGFAWGETYETIGSVYDVTRERARQIVLKVMSNLTYKPERRAEAGKFQVIIEEVKS